MAPLASYFTDFLQRIRPSDSDRQAFIAAHTGLRQLLMADQLTARHIVSTFLQGSYRRATAIRAYQGHQPDVDVVVVTRLSSQEYSAAEAQSVFKPFLREHYPNQWGTNERSLSISVSGVKLDLVVTSAPAYADVGILSSEASADGTAEDDDGTTETDNALWKLEPLLIPDRQAASWQATHPLAQLAWTRFKNRNTNGHFVNVVKALKWWKRITQGMPKHPRSYPLERLIGECCPNDISDVASGIARTLEAIASSYCGAAQAGQVPHLPNHGIPGQNVFARVPSEDFRAFMERVNGAARLARRALDCGDIAESASLWRELLGDEFPAAGSSGSSSGGFSPRTSASVIGAGRFG